MQEYEVVVDAPFAVLDVYARKNSVVAVVMKKVWRAHLERMSKKRANTTYCWQSAPILSGSSGSASTRHTVVHVNAYDNFDEFLNTRDYTWLGDQFVRIRENYARKLRRCTVPSQRMKTVVSRCTANTVIVLWLDITSRVSDDIRHDARRYVLLGALHCEYAEAALRYNYDIRLSDLGFGHDANVKYVPKRKAEDIRSTDSAPIRLKRDDDVDDCATPKFAGVFTPCHVVDML